eukprot:6179016-Prymnesium_polylepis.1
MTTEYTKRFRRGGFDLTRGTWRTMLPAGTARTLHAHSGADFERGRVGHRNGPQIAGTEYDVSDGTLPEEQPVHTGGAPGTGLAQRSSSASKVRKPSQTLPARMGPVWATVKVVGREYDTTPTVVCKDCNKQYCGGLS